MPRPIHAALIPILTVYIVCQQRLLINTTVILVVKLGPEPAETVCVALVLEIFCHLLGVHMLCIDKCGQHVALVDITQHRGNCAWRSGTELVSTFYIDHDSDGNKRE